MKLRVCLVIFSFLSAMGGTVVAQTAASNSTQVPRLIKFSGVAKDESGKPLSGVVGITFSLYKDQQAGAPLWMETQNVQADAAGHYTALLGSASIDGVPLDLFSSGAAQWLGVQIQGRSEQPRVWLVSVPYALKAHEAETLSGKNISDFVLANDAKAQSNPTKDSQATSNGVHSSTPPPPSGPTTFTGSNSTQIVGVTQNGSGAGLSATATTHAAVAGTITGPSNTAIYGLASNTSVGSNAAGVTGQANTQLGPGVQGVTTSAKGLGVQGVVNSISGGVAVQGLNKATTAAAYGVSGSVASTGAGSAAVIGTESSTSGLVFGVQGQTNSTTANAAGVNGFEGATTGAVHGVAGSTSSTGTNAAGVSGFEGATTGQVFGVSGGTNSATNGAAGVDGFANATSGAVYGVAGFSNSPNGVGTLGQANANSGTPTGVLGSTVSTNGIGVFGLSSTASGGKGVQGQTESTSGGVAGMFVAHGGAGLILAGLSGSAFTSEFYVDASGNGFFAGNLNVTGKLTKGSGSFKIDHPLDPANKYLSHSFVESPDMMNVYNGNITTDRRGLATVTLPDYFEALNQDFRYQLTVIGKFAQAVVKQEITNNRFTIKTSKPSVKVSLAGDRHPARRLRQGLPHSGRRRKATAGTGALPPPGAVRCFSGASGRLPHDAGPDAGRERPGVVFDSASRPAAITRLRGKD